MLRAFALLGLLIAVSWVVGCQTVEGVGKDIQGASQSVQEWFAE